MIDVKSIRINSHILSLGERVMVTEITDEVIEYYVPSEDKVEYCNAKESTIEPILITAGVLASVGFVVDGKHCADNKVTFVSGKQWDAYITYNTYTKMYIAHFGLFDVTRVKYLHEVEMMWYMVYGKELIEDE